MRPPPLVKIKATPYKTLPDEILFHPRLSFNAVRAFAYISSWFTPGNTRRCSASEATIAKAVGCTPRSVRRALRMLRKEGLVRTIHVHSEDGSGLLGCLRFPTTAPEAHVVTQGPGFEFAHPNEFQPPELANILKFTNPHCDESHNDHNQPKSGRPTSNSSPF